MLHAILGIVPIGAIPRIARAAGAAASFARRGRQSASQIAVHVAAVVGPVGPGVAAAVGRGALALPEIADAVAAPRHGRDAAFRGGGSIRVVALGVQSRVDRSRSVVFRVVEEQTERALVRFGAESLGYLAFVQDLELLDESLERGLGVWREVGVGHEHAIALAVVIHATH